MIITAHRGASGVAPENTIAALNQAIKDGADFAEIDIQTTKDGKIILLHDDTLDRTTNGTGPVGRYNWGYLKKLDAGVWFDNKFSGEKIPLLNEVIDVVKGKMQLNIEVKTDSFSFNKVQDLIDTIYKKDFIDQCIITSFQRPLIDYISQIDAQIQTGIIFSSLPDSLEEIYNSSYDILSCHFTLINKKLVQQTHSYSKQVHVWTVNEENEMLKMIEYGVDSIITNYPGLLKNLL